MSLSLHRGRGAPGKETGFSMIEVLISLVLIAVAMLGAANLQLQALKLGKGAAFRMHALTLAMEIGERMEANKTGAVTSPSPYETATSTAARTVGKDCTGVPCTATELANFDLGSWESSLVTNLPAASWSITNTTPGNPSTYSIVVSWTDRRDSNTYATTGTTEAFSYTAVRTVSQ
jgi:type IV pilus assembly protein PilV